MSYRTYMASCLLRSKKPSPKIPLYAMLEPYPHDLALLTAMQIEHVGSIGVLEMIRAVTGRVMVPSVSSGTMQPCSRHLIEACHKSESGIADLRLGYVL